MIFSKQMKFAFSSLLASLFIGVLAGCSLQPLQLQTNLIEIAPNVNVTIPTPADLGYRLTASQLISAQWNTSQQEQQQQQLPVQLEVNKDKLALAGFSSWGARILTLSYQNQIIDASVLTGLEATLPQPEQVLFNLMITLWPVESWQPHLSHINWRLVESNHQRQLFDDKGTLVADIHYQASPYLEGPITFSNHQLGYTITITTLSHTQQDQ